MEKISIKELRSNYPTISLEVLQHALAIAQEKGETPSVCLRQAVMTYAYKHCNAPCPYMVRGIASDKGKTAKVILKVQTHSMSQHPVVLALAHNLAYDVLEYGEDIMQQQFKRFNLIASFGANIDLCSVSTKVRKGGISAAYCHQGRVAADAFLPLSDYTPSDVALLECIAMNGIFYYSRYVEAVKKLNLSTARSKNIPQYMQSFEKYLLRQNLVFTKEHQVRCGTEISIGSYLQYQSSRIDASVLKGLEIGIFGV